MPRFGSSSVLPGKGGRGGAAYAPHGYSYGASDAVRKSFLDLDVAGSANPSFPGATR